MLDIEKNIPIPKHKSKYPFLVMKVGDSFTAPLAQYSSINTLKWKTEKNTGYKYMLRKIDNNTLRVWRTR